jgi:histidine ammonia-lyase
MILLNGKDLTLEHFRRVAREREPCSLDPAARERVEASRAVVKQVVSRGDPVYGVNTGFGELARERVSDAEMQLLQERLLLSHAAGVARPLDDEAVRGMLVLRANTLALGYSGVRVELIERLLAMLERGLLPVVPSRGSVGASGDLAPLSHLALPIIGRGWVRVGGVEQDAAAALAEAGLEPLSLEPKEGLALINGTQATTSLVALAALETRTLVRLADLIGALATDAFRGADTCFDPRLHELRPHPGQRTSAANLWRLLKGSGIRESHRRGDQRIQDPYSFRCMPQVHGAVRDVLADVERRLEVEMNAATDNPLVLPETGEILPGGNFHAEPVAFAADFLAVALAELGSISERRIEKLNQSTFSGLPPFLVENPGLNSGFMIAQVTAAALVSENRALAHPASVDNVPTSADKEDHVSMSMGAALRLRRMVRNVRRVLAIELLLAAQGIEFLRPLQSSKELEVLHASLRREVPTWREDRVMAEDLAAAESFLRQSGGDLVVSLE